MWRYLSAGINIVIARTENGTTILPGTKAAFTRTIAQIEINPGGSSNRGDVLVSCQALVSGRHSTPVFSLMLVFEMIRRTEIYSGCCYVTH